MTACDNDKAILESVARVANDTSAVSPDFASQIIAMAQETPQQRASIMSRLIKAFGGWGFAAPQLAGLVVSAFLGLSAAQTQVAEVDLTDQEARIMTAHLFGDEDSWEGWE